jgi:hypothetical protein
MAAEAHNKSTTANDALARKYLNEVERELLVIIIMTFLLRAAFDFIQAERRVELAGEGFVSLI